MNWIIFIVLVLFTLSARATDLTLENPNYAPDGNKHFIGLDLTTNKREVEYESSNSMVDNQITKSKTAIAKYLYGLTNKFTIGLVTPYFIERSYEIKFGPASSKSGTAPISGDGKGLVDPELILIWQFEPIEHKWNQQLILQGNPWSVEEKKGRLYKGGRDLFVEYRYTHFYDDGFLHGTVFSHYYGKKHFYQPGENTHSTSEATTEVGFTVGRVWKLFEQWRIRSSAKFGLGSDYVVQNPSVRKSADKGHHWGGEFEFGRYFGPNFFLSMAGRSETRIYNADNEDINRNIDYEVEDNAFSLNLKWELH